MILTEPSAAYEKELLAYRQEFLEPGSSADGAGRLIRFDSIKNWLDYTEACKRANNVPEGQAPISHYLYVREKDRKIVGIVQIRHILSEQAERYAGHVGYTVVPSERRKGYAIQMLGLALQKCKALGIGQVLILCDRDNEASRRTILKNGGIYESTVYEKERDRYLERYRFDLAESI